MSNYQEMLDEAVRDINDRDRELQVDYTPEPLVTQMMLWLKTKEAEDALGFKPEFGRLIDPCAGHGVFGKIFRLYHKESPLPRSMSGSFGCEIRREEREHLKKHYDVVTCEDTRSFDSPWDNKITKTLVATNPAFKLALNYHRDHKSPDGGMVKQYCEKLREGDLMTLLLPGDFWKRNPAKVEVFKKYIPAIELCVPLPISFRNGINPRNGKRYSADFRSYSWFIWDHKFNQRKSWQSIMLPGLPSFDRKWTDIPGS